ncbi:MAG: hypothetical protein Q7K42_00285, partial [Candidatus Diapherotrites archaeon]|nr:hypothetical protein [Candidatus Diapherotrites archaeon]
MAKPKTYSTSKKFKPLLMKKLWENAEHAYPMKNPEEWREKFRKIVAEKKSKELESVLPGNFVYHCYNWTRHTGMFDENIIRIFKQAIQPDLKKGTGNVSLRVHLEAHMITARAGDFI